MGCQFTPRLVADSSVQQIIENNLSFANAICEDVEGEVAAVNKFAKDVDCANAQLIGLLNAVSQELVLIQQRINQEQSKPQPDPRVLDLLGDKFDILSGVVGAMTAAVASDSALVAALDALRVKLVAMKNQALHFGNAMREILGHSPLDPFTDPGREPKPIPTFDLPNSPDIGDFIEDNQQLLNTIADAVDDGKPAKKGAEPDKADALVDNKNVLDNVDKTVGKLIMKIEKEIAKLKDSVVSGDPRIVSKLAELGMLRDGLKTVDTAPAGVANDVDAINVGELHDAITEAIENMRNLRRRTP